MALFAEGAHLMKELTYSEHFKEKSTLLEQLRRHFKTARLPWFATELPMCLMFLLLVL